MSNIYIQEPSTSGKVVLKTTVGDIDVELWARECPKACRNFIQLCLEGYYNGTIFHRVVKGFIVQGGDPNGDGTGGESIWGEPFKDEFHSRLRFVRRGLVGMANSDKDDNGSQFFFTMSPTPELQNKNTLFGKVTGDTVYNMLKLQEGLVDHNERPMYPHKIIKAEVLSNPFDDVVPRVLKKKTDKKEKRKKEKGVKNFGLLSFGEEAEEDEEETNEYVQKNAGKAKSLHDVVDDPKLSKEVVKKEKVEEESDDDRLSGDEAIKIKEESDDEDTRLNRIQNKLKSKLSSKRESKVPIKKEPESDSDDDVLITHEQDIKIKTEKKKEELRQEMLAIKKEYQTQKKIKNELLEKKTVVIKENDDEEKAKENHVIKDYLEERKKYKEMCSQIPKKGPSREEFTLSLLAKFRSKLNNLKQEEDEETVSAKDGDVEEDIRNDNWMKHRLNFQEKLPILAKDASTKDDDWYDVYDPRNPLNKRKRGEGKAQSNKDYKRHK